MTFIRSERKCVEILRILGENSEPIGAKRLSELMAEHGFILSDRAVQYYLSYLDEKGFTFKVGNRGRILSESGRSEIEQALVDERVGFIISKLERLAFRSTFNPETATGDVAYNLSFVPFEYVEKVSAVFDRVLGAGLGFFSSYRIMDKDPRIPAGHAGFITVCSITMDGVMQRAGIPVKMAYGGTLRNRDGKATGFDDVIAYTGTTIDPLSLFISAGQTSIKDIIAGREGVALANVREVPVEAKNKVESLISQMRECGFVFPVTMGCNVFNLMPNPYRLSLVSYSGMNCVGCVSEEGYPIRTLIGAGNIPFSRL